MIPPEVLINGAANTILYEQEPAVLTISRQPLQTLRDQPLPASGAGTLRELLCCLPKVLVPDNITYENIFRVIIMQFIDAHSFDVRSVKKTCVHIVHPDGRLIPFDTYNLFYRDGLEQTRLDPLQKAGRSCAGGRYGRTLAGDFAALDLLPCLPYIGGTSFGRRDHAKRI